MARRRLRCSRRIRFRRWNRFNLRIVLQKFHDLFVRELVVDFDEAVALLQVLEKFVRRDLINRCEVL